MVNRLTRDQDVVVCAAGSMPGDLHKMWRTRDRKGYHVEYGFSCMGYEIAGGLGVKMAVLDAGEDRDVVVMVGDGSYLMMSQEIVTAVQEGVKLIVVLVQNQGFASIGALSESSRVPALRDPLPLPHADRARRRRPPGRPRGERRQPGRSSDRGQRDRRAGEGLRRRAGGRRHDRDPRGDRPAGSRAGQPRLVGRPGGRGRALESTRDARATYDNQKARQRSHLRPVTDERDER